MITRTKGDFSFLPGYLKICTRGPLGRIFLTWTSRCVPSYRRNKYPPSTGTVTGTRGRGIYVFETRVIDLIGDSVPIMTKGPRKSTF